MPDLSPTMLRIARRVAQVALEPSDANDLRAAIIRLDQDLKRQHDRYGPTISPYLQDSNHANVYYAMARLVIAVARTRAIPKESRTLFALARKETSRTRKFDRYEWFTEKGHKFVPMLLQSDDWPLLSEQGGDVVQVGGFQVSNSTSLDGDAAVDIVAKAVRALKASDVPGVERCLYGPVRIVGNISGNAKVLAWYFHTLDEIEVLYKKKYDAKAVNSLIHEIGHRYYRKFLPGVVKSKWYRHHQVLNGSQFDVPLDKLAPGLQLNFYNGKPVIDRVVMPYVYFVGDTAKYKFDGILRDMMRARERGVYPTPYAAKNEEEHFCEALALYVLGDLKEPHLSAFKRIVVEGE